MNRARTTGACEAEARRFDSKQVASELDGRKWRGAELGKAPIQPR